MLGVRYSSRFKKDFKACIKRHYNMKLLQDIIDILRIPERPALQYEDHNLSGNYKEYRECHVAPDWLLIYRYQDEDLVLYRTGTHADLFGL